MQTQMPQHSTHCLQFCIKYLDEILRALSILPFLVSDSRSKVDDDNKKNNTHQLTSELYTHEHNYLHMEVVVLKLL